MAADAPPSADNVKPGGEASESSRAPSRHASGSVDSPFTTEKMSEKMTSLVTFNDCGSDICRGVPVQRLLGRAGGIFARAGGSSATFGLSRVTGELFGFVSHNWATPRFKKYWTLLFYFNFNFAFAVASLYLLLGGAASAAGWMPTVPDRKWQVPCGFLCRFLCLPIFFLCLVLRAELGACLGGGGPLVFLDKVCISQTDPELMQQGIRKLGAFISNARCMIVVFTDLYTTKLWTVYEVAVFITLHPLNKLVILPVQNATFFIVACGFTFMYNIVHVSARSTSDAANAIALGLAMAWYGVLWGARSWAWARHATMERLATFSVRQATCAVEADRPVVYENIACLLAARGLVEPGADLEASLDRFDVLVRAGLPDTFREAFGAASFSRKHYLFINMALSGALAMDGLSWAPGGKPVREVAVSTMVTLIFATFAGPLLFLLAERLANMWLPWRGCRSHLLLLAHTSVLTAITVALLLALDGALYQAALEGDAAFGALTALSSLSAAQNLLPHKWVKRRCRRRRAARASLGPMAATAPSAAKTTSTSESFQATAPSEAPLAPAAPDGGDPCGAAGFAGDGDGALMRCRV